MPWPVLHSTPQTIKDERISWSAIIETAISVVAFAYIADCFDLPTIAFVSVLVTLLLLLRSDASVALGVKWLEAYWSRDFGEVLREQGIALQSHRFWLSVCFALSVAMASAYGLAIFLVVDHQGVSAIVRGIFAGYFGLQAGISITVGLAAREVLAVTRTALRVTAALLSFLVLSAFILVAKIAGAGDAASLAMGATAGLIVVAATVMGWEAASAALTSGQTIAASIATAAVRRKTLSFVINLPGLLVGALFRTVLIRAAATARHILRGLKVFPYNWRRAVLVVDHRSAPEVVPGYRRRNLFNLLYVLARLQIRDRRRQQQHRHFRRRQRQILYFPALLILFGPAYFYRFYIKSTFWFYYPLIYLSKPLSHDPDGFADILWKDAWEWTRRVVAIGSITAFCVSTVGPQIYFIKENLHPDVIAGIEYVFFLEYSGVKPWQLCMLGSAALTILIFLLSSRFRIEVRNLRYQTAKVPRIELFAYCIELLMRFRNFCVLAFFTFVIAHRLISLESVSKYSPRWILSVFQWVYS